VIESRLFTIEQTPPSKNSNLVRSHWKDRHQAKQGWERLLAERLDELDLPRPIPSRGPVRVFVTLRFASSRGQESENYRGLLSEALGDALRRGRWLPDDKDEHWRLSLAILPDRGPAATTVRLMWAERPA
jgi:hypothetical protein